MNFSMFSASCLLVVTVSCQSESMTHPHDPLLQDSSGESSPLFPDLPPLPEHNPINIGTPKPSTPETVVLDYIKLASKGDLSKLKPLLDPECFNSEFGRAAPIKMMGFLMKITSVKTALKTMTGDNATVITTISGSVDAKNATAETTLLGKKTSVKVGSMTMDNITKSSNFNLKKISDHWRITCKTP